MAKIYKDDFGTKIVVSTGVDLTGVATKNIVVKKPSGTIVTWNASIEGVATKGQLSYIIVSGNLDEAGLYCAYVHIKFETGGIITAQYIGESFSFQVFNAFE